MRYFNRYSIFNQNNNIPRIIPFLKIRTKSSDKTIIWNKEYRLYNISNDYYGTPYYDWLIAQKNVDKGMDEFEWQNGDTIIIPYPLEISKEQYIQAYEEYQRLN